MADLHIAEDQAAFVASAAEWIARALREIAGRAGRCAVALAGGRTVGPVYQRLAELPKLPWPQLTIYFGDERAVPPDHPESNYRLARETLLARVPLRASQVHRMEAERADRERAARDYDALLPDSLDLLLLGMGADGHVASLFPGADTLRETRRRVVPAEGGVPLLPRLTITPPVIRAAARVLVLVRGAEKAGAVTRALATGGDSDAVPARLARGGTWILDRTAAGALAQALP